MAVWQRRSPPAPRPVARRPTARSRLLLRYFKTACPFALEVCSSVQAAHRLRLLAHCVPLALPALAAKLATRGRHRHSRWDPLRSKSRTERQVIALGVGPAKVCDRVLEASIWATRSKSRDLCRACGASSANTPRLLRLAPEVNTFRRSVYSAGHQVAGRPSYCHQDFLPLSAAGSASAFNDVPTSMSGLSSPAPFKG